MQFPIQSHYFQVLRRSYGPFCLGAQNIRLQRNHNRKKRSKNKGGIKANVVQVHKLKVQHLYG